MLFWSLKGNSLKSRPRKAENNPDLAFLGCSWRSYPIFFAMRDPQEVESIFYRYFSKMSELDLIKSYFSIFFEFFLYILCKFSLRLDDPVFGQLTYFVACSWGTWWTYIFKSFQANLTIFILGGWFKVTIYIGSNEQSVGETKHYTQYSKSNYKTSLQLPNCVVCDFFLLLNE